MRYFQTCLSLTAIALATMMISSGAYAQAKGSVQPRALPPLANPNDPKLAAKELFGRVMLPANVQPQVIGFYSKGCIAGAEGIDINGPNWQVMRLSRNRNWGHPDLVALIKRLSVKANAQAGWPGILVGDMSQPRGGPMLTGHASHQLGLDADIWLTPMPNRMLSRQEREEMSAVRMVRPDRLDINPSTWTPRHLPVIRAAAQEPSVERIFVNAAIKKALCREARGDRQWLSKVRPAFGHDYHFHIRMKCPAGNPLCEPQKPVVEGVGCSEQDLAYWFSDAVLNPKPPKEPPKPRPPLTLSDLHPACRQVLATP